MIFDFVETVKWFHRWPELFEKQCQHRTRRIRIQCLSPVLSSLQTLDRETDRAYSRQVSWIGRRQLIALSSSQQRSHSACIRMILNEKWTVRDVNWLCRWVKAAAVQWFMWSVWTQQSTRALPIKRKIFFFSCVMLTLINSSSSRPIISLCVSESKRLIFGFSIKDIDTKHTIESALEFFDTFLWASANYVNFTLTFTLLNDTCTRDEERQSLFTRSCEIKKKLFLFGTLPYQWET